MQKVKSPSKEARCTTDTLAMQTKVKDPIVFTIRQLPGERKFDSPLDSQVWFDDEFMIVDTHIHQVLNSALDCPIVVEKAGPRKKLYFDPSNTTVAVTTAGGLSPGLNNVIRAIVMICWWKYGIRKILGLKYGFEGLNPATSQIVELTPTVVRDIHRCGGCILGSSRGPQEVKVMVDFLESRKIDILFTIGGDGTQKGALEIVKEITKRNLKIAVVGIPKTIDNDLACTERTFGFQTAVELAQRSINAAHEEARGARNGIGLVKLMGRDSGFIALHATLANSDVNLLLIPEVPFALEKVFQFVEWRLRERSHCVIVVSEGAGEEYVGIQGKDASGNVKLGDIGLFLKEALEKYLQSKNMEHSVKYIDPSYTIRSAPTNAQDSIFCVLLAHQAVHAALAGKTGMIVGVLSNTYVHIPIERAVVQRKKVDPFSLEYRAMLDNTGIPQYLK
jgi:6-phosphofructokinase 1